MNSPLNEKLQSVEWGEFSVGDLFDIFSAKKRFDANKVSVLDYGKFPYVVRMGTNNGQKGFINEAEIFLNEGNTISFGQDTATMYYQAKPYFTGDKIKILKAKDQRFGEQSAQFFISAMQKPFSSFSWGASLFNVEVVKKQKLQLPVKNGAVDFDFIESFITELEAERIAELEAYSQAAGLKDYELTEEERWALEAFEELEWKEFNVVDVFDVNNSRSILSRDVVENSGKTPYLCASAENNAVSTYIAYDDSYLDKGDCIFIGGKTFVVTYQAKDFYSNDSHNLILHLKDAEKKNRLNQLFMVACVNKGLRHRYSWGDSISNKKIQSDKVALPVKDNYPDYAIMETLISAIQKLAIREVVQYADQKIAAASSVFNGIE